MSNELIAAIKTAGVSPCVKYHCIKREKCADFELACDSFKNYVETGRALPPNASIPAGSLNPGHMRRIASVLKRLGYVEARHYVDGVRSRFWSKRDGSGGLAPASDPNASR